MEKQDPKQQINISEYQSLVGKCLEGAEGPAGQPAAPASETAAGPAAETPAAAEVGAAPADIPMLRETLTLLIFFEGLALLVWLLVSSASQPTVNGSAAAMELRQQLGADHIYWELASQLRRGLAALPLSNPEAAAKALTDYNIQTRTPDDGYDETYQGEDLKPDFLRRSGSLIDYSEPAEE